MIRAVVFDLWNTLIHSRGGDPFRHLRALMTEAQRAQEPAFRREAMTTLDADPEALLDRWAPRLGLSEEQRHAMIGVFRSATEDAECFPEACEALDATRRIARVALLSNTQRFGVEFLDRLGITERIPTRFLSAELGVLKPEPAAFEAVARRLGLFPSQLAMGGDYWNDDVQGALQAGWTALWLNRTGRPRPDHDPEAPLVEIQDLSQVPAIIQRLQAGARCSTCLG